MKKDLISVIMATKDTELNMLKSSIDSILCQTYKNFEFIIVCDGSEQDYNFIKKTYDDNRIVILKNETSIGLTKSLNKAIRSANGEYIARMDSDDISLNNRFEVQIDYLKKNENVGICSMYTRNFGNNSKYNINLFNNSDGVKAQLFLYNNLAHPAIMMRKEFIDKNNITYDETFKYSQDFELWSRCCDLTDFYVIPKMGLYYRIHNNQISTAKLEEQNELCRKIYLRNLKKLDIKDCSEKVKYLFYLSGKSSQNINENEIDIFIKEVINNNDCFNIYDKKILKTILYFNLCFIKLKKEKKIINIKYFVKGKVVSLYIKKLFNMFILKLKKF